jgi:hypothetical protein
MNPNLWLIAIGPVIVGAVLGAVLSPGLGRAVLALARARAQRVKYVPVSGAHLYAYGVPLTDEQFREAFAAMNADLGRLPPPAERSDWEMQEQYAAVNRFSVLTGRFPHAYSIRQRGRRLGLVPGEQSVCHSRPAAGNRPEVSAPTRHRHRLERVTAR